MGLVQSVSEYNYTKGFCSIQRDRKLHIGKAFLTPRSKDQGDKKDNAVK